jgi:hypothetical protein
MRTMVVARNPRRAIIRPATAQGCNMGLAVIQIGTGQSFLLFDGLVFDANNVCTIVARHEGSGPGVASSYVTYQNSLFKGAVGTFAEAASGMATVGYTVTGVFDHLYFLGNEFDGSSIQPGNGCLNLDGNSNVADGNYIHHCGLSGIVSTHQRGSVNLVVRNNLISNTGGSAINLSGQNHLVYNNVLVNNSGGRRGGGVVGTYIGAAMQIQGANDGSINDNIAFYNNTVYNHNGALGCLWVDPGFAVSNTQFRNNICYGTNAIISTSGGTPTISNNRCASGCTTADDPRFVDAASWNFRLSTSSPFTIVGAGVDLSRIFTSDFEGGSRTQTAPFDLGAFELR